MSMRCPNCSSEAPPGPACLRCGAPLGALPGPDHPSSVLLSGMQKARLIVDCLPLLFFALALVFVVTSFDDIVGAPPPTALLLFLGLVIIVMGLQAFQRTRDLVSGVALVQDDVLQRAYRSRGQGRHFWGTFAQLGKLSLTTKAYHQGQAGRRHRVVYSPASKIVWSLERLD
jgi:hypothetical protein